MHIVITGANGFVGKALAKKIERDKALCGKAVTKLTLIDLGFDESDFTDSFVEKHAGDLTDANWLCAVVAESSIDALFHLASVPGGSAENNYELAKAVNLDATLTLLEICKDQASSGGTIPVFVFASSIAVLGKMPSFVNDQTLPKPQMTYGSHKLIGEVLVEDFNRREWIDGRSLRLPGVLARPPARTGQLSAFLSDIIRELSEGRPFVCPTSSSAQTWASSLPCVVDALIHGACVPTALLNNCRTFTLPTLHFSMFELVDAISVVYSRDVSDLVSWKPDDKVEAFFGRFPPLETASADSAGFCHDGNIEALVRRALTCLH